MSCLSFCLSFCKRAVAIAVLFSSLVCNAWAAERPASSSKPRPAVITPAASVFANAIGMARQARADGDYTVTDEKSRTVTPGTYSQIIVNAHAASKNDPDIIIGPGTVILDGNKAPLFNVAITEGMHNKVQLETKSDPAILRLVQGNATGTIGIGPYMRRASQYGAYKDNFLYIGSGSEEPAKTTVTITGNINGIGRAAIDHGATAESLLETQGANLVVKGNISDNQSYTMLRTLNAYNGNIETVSDEKSSLNATFDIFAYNVNLKPGNHVRAADDFTASSVNIPENAYIYAGQRLDVLETIGGAGGSMAPGSTLEADNNFLVLRGGVTKAAGTIKADKRSILTNDTTKDYREETALGPIRQGGDDPLALVAGWDIESGDVDVDSMTASRDVVAGTFTFIRGTHEVGVLPDRYLLDAGGNGFNYPRATITANTIDVKGRLLAGELDMPRATGGKEASLKAGNLWITNTAPAENGFEKASGNFTLDNGSFILSNADNLKIQKSNADKSITDETLPYASIVDGDMTVTRNKDSSFTTLSVGKTASISEGTLKGTTLVANAAALTDVTATNIDTLDVATTLSMTGNGQANIRHTKVGGKADISSGSYSGTDFIADSANFTGVSGVTMTDSLETASGFNLTGSGSSSIKTLTAGGEAAISGGSFSGETFTANSAEFSAVNGIKLSESLTVESGLTLTDSVASNIAAATVKSGDATVTGGSYAGGMLTAQNARFENVSGVNLSDRLNIKGDLNLDSTGASNIKTAEIGGEAAISGGSFSGETFTANSAKFSAVNRIKLSDSLTVESGLTLTDSVASNIAAATVKSGDATVTGGSYAGGSLTANNARFENISGVSLSDSLNISGDLNLGGTGASNIKTAEIGGKATISGGSYAGESFTAGNADFSNLSDLNLVGNLKSGGNVSLDNVSANIGGATTVGGDFTMSGASSATVKDMTVGKSISMDSGYLNADAVTAAAARFTNNSSAEFDDLKLTGSDLTLVIDSGPLFSSIMI